jgi:ribosomal protein L22
MADEKTPEEEPKKRRGLRRRKKDEPAAEAKGQEAAKAAEETPAEEAPEQEAAPEETKAESKPEAEEKPKKGRGKKDEGEEPEAEAPKPVEPKARPLPTPAPVEEIGGVERPVVRAKARYVRTSARKARLVCNHIRGRSVPDARAILDHAPRAVARDWSKLLESAVANAENNHELPGDELVVLVAQADEGPKLRRFRPRAQGRASRINKRTSHLSIALSTKGEE